MGVDAVRVLSHVEQPVQVAGRAVTFWHELPPHTEGTWHDTAIVLRKLHSLPPPDTFELPQLSPFVRLTERIEGAHFLSPDDRAWMLERLADLRRRYAALPPGLPITVVHGDAWGGNIAVTPDGRRILHDFERCSLGPPEWDSIHSAIKHSSFGWAPPEEYADYVTVYGYDVTEWAGFATLRDIREFRMTCMAVQVATEEPRVRDQALHRLACIRGERGPRPWSGWRGVP
nr:aminoglycoside phosphotransferase family protein [Streptoalloteichus tenebrarius]